MAPRPRALELEPVPESDREGDLPHPREQLELYGHESACRALAQAARSGQLHHAWIIAGPKGVGKATLAWRFVRSLLAHGAQDCNDQLTIGDDHPVRRQIAALSHPDLILLRRPWDFTLKKFKSELPVDEVRKLRGFFSRHSSFGGARIAVIDCADDMNSNSQNALLKILEEPPKGALLLLISHAPGALLATTRSRCRMLTLRKLSHEATRTAVGTLRPGLREDERELVSALADGAPGRALAFAEAGAAGMYRDVVELLGGLPRMDAGGVFAFAEKTAKLPAENGMRLFSTLLMQVEERLLRGAFGAQHTLSSEQALMRKLQQVMPLESWQQLWERLRHETGRAYDLNLDKKQHILNTLFAIEAAAQH